MPRYLPADVGATANAAAVEVIEEGTTFVPEVIDSLQLYDGGVTVVVVEIEYEHVGGATPAAAACIAAVFGRFGPMPIGVCAVRNIAGTSTPSQHSWCNAVDFMCSGALHRAVAYFIDANRGPLDVHWLGADPYFPSPRGDHYGHVHADFYPQYPL
jgi:hypothetical protein